MEKLLKQRVEILAQEVEKMKSGGAGEGYTKAEADAKFLSKDDASTALAGKQDRLNQTQLVAVNSGIDGTKVAQIETNKTNILLLERMNGAKNYIDSKTKSQTITTDGANITVTVNPDKSFEIIGTTGSSDIFIGVSEETVLPAGDYVFSGLLSGAGSGLYLYMAQGSTYVHITNGTYPIAEFSINSNQVYTVAVRLEANKSYSTPQKIYPMICDKSAWDSGLTQYMPYALSNYDLTKAINETIIKSVSIANADLNGISETGFALYVTPTNMPTGTSGNAFVRTSVYDANTALQELTLAATGASYIRVKATGTWGAWAQTTNI